MKKILVIGAAGFLGRAITQHFTRLGWDVYGLDRVAPALDGLKDYAALELPHPRFLNLLAEWNLDACIHAAGRASVPLSMQDPAADFQDGPALTFYLLDALRQRAPKIAFILLSSAAVYGNPVALPVGEEQPPAPISAYGYHKLQSEMLCREFADLWRMKTASARIFSAYGIGLRRQVVWDIAQKASTQGEVTLQGDGNESRDFIHADDIANGLNILLDHAPLCGEVYNLSSGNETKISDLANLIMKNLESNSKIIFSGELPAGTPKNWRADIRKISALGFSPNISLEAGIADLMKAIRAGGK